MNDGMGGHQSTNMITSDWITPPDILAKLGPFDLDPCASLTQPWPTAARSYTVNDNGLIQEWQGRVWLNPPYGLVAKKWLQRLADHGDGIALIFARTETDMFFSQVWERADALRFIRGRISFYYPDGTCAPNNGGAPSVLIAYGSRNAKVLEMVDIPGKFVPLYHFALKEI